MGPRNFIRILALVTVVDFGLCWPYSTTKSTQICYEGLGCFTTEHPFDNTLNILPESPGLINTTFRLFTSSCIKPYVLQPGDFEFVSKCNFDPALPLKIVVHGFLQHGQADWVREMTAAFLNKEPMSVVTVDWGSRSGLPYAQAAANTRVVGAEIAHVINYLRKHANMSLDVVHIIGHSLGAHIAGYAGEEVPGVARITGLDPAELCYSDTDPVVHLDKTDAKFVDIIHSDGSEPKLYSGYGWMKDTGHIDFYPNGGEHQPGCEDPLSFGVGCSHSRAIDLFTESIESKCIFYGYPCESISDFDSNKDNCLRCAHDVCPEMGYNADKSPARGKFYLRTRTSSPFCGYTKHVKVEFGDMKLTKGKVKLEMIGDNLPSDIVVIDSGNDPYMAGDLRDVITVDRERTSDVVELLVTFASPSHWSAWFTWSTEPHCIILNMITITSANNGGQSFHFCGGQRCLNDGNSVILINSGTDPEVCSETSPLNPKIKYHEIF